MLGLLASFAQAAPATSRPTDADARLQVMTFNIRYGTADDGPNSWQHRRDLVFGVLAQHRPHLVGLQEALKFQLDEILAARPEYAALGVGREDGKESGEYSAILYCKDRFRVVEQGTFWLSETPEVPGSKSWNTACTRVCTWARLADRASGRHLYFFNTHLDHVSQEAREKGAALILQRIAERKPADPVILTGDFNAGEGNVAIRKVKESGLRDSFRMVKPDAKPAGTFNGWKARTDGDKIDYVFVSEEVVVRDAEILHDNKDGRYPSDHFPVIAIIEWK